MRIKLICFVLSFSGWSTALGADPLDAPFTIKNGNPFISLFGLPQVHSASPRAGWGLRYDVASNFDGSVFDRSFAETGTSGLRSEQVVLDGETERLSLDFYGGFGAEAADGTAQRPVRRWGWGVSVPWVRHSGGYLDNLIVDWHDWFNLPQNGRDVAVNDQLTYAFANDDHFVGIDDSTSSLGDIQLTLDRSLGRLDKHHPTLLRVHLKLPTGDDDKLTGSGGMDLALSFHQHWQMSQRWDADFSLGAAYLSDSGLLDDLVRPLVGKAGVKVGYRVLDNVWLKVQWDVHSQVYESTRLKQLNEIAYILSFGGSVRIGNYLLELVVTENYPHPEITPDVAFQVGLRRAF